MGTHTRRVFQATSNHEGSQETRLALACLSGQVSPPRDSAPLVEHAELGGESTGHGVLAPDCDRVSSPAAGCKGTRWPQLACLGAGV